MHLTPEKKHGYAVSFFGFTCFLLFNVTSLILHSFVWPQGEVGGLLALGVQRTVFGRSALPFSAQSRIHLIYLFMLNTNYLNVIKDRNSQRYKCFMSQLLSRHSRIISARYSIYVVLYLQYILSVGSSCAGRLVILLYCLHFSDNSKEKKRKAREESSWQVFLLLNNETVR